MPSEFYSAPSTPLLTIAIPTYNRASNLELLLSGLAPQLKKLPQVELIVSDNASPDSTEELMRRLLDEGLSCRYIRNSTNIGSDLNFLQCYREAAGKYVWIFGDDDYLFPCAAARVVSLLDQAEYDRVYLAPSGFAHTPNERGVADKCACYSFSLISRIRLCRLFARRSHTSHLGHCQQGVDRAAFPSRLRDGQVYQPSSDGVGIYSSGTLPPGAVDRAWHLYLLRSQSSTRVGRNSRFWSELGERRSALAPSPSTPGHRTQ